MKIFAGYNGKKEQAAGVWSHKERLWGFHYNDAECILDMLPAGFPRFGLTLWLGKLYLGVNWN